MAPGSKTAGLAQVHQDLGQPTLTVTIRRGRVIETASKADLAPPLMLGALLFPRSPAVFCTAFAKHNNLRILDQHAGIISPALDLPPTEGDPLSPAPWMKHEQSNDNTLGFIALPGRATRMNQWTFFNKKIGALKHQAADGNAPATVVKETTSGRNRGPKPKKAGSDDEPAAPIVASQEYQPQQVLTGKFMPMNEVVQTVAALPSSMDANGERPYQGALPNPGPMKTRSTRPCLCVSFLGMLRPMSIPHSEVKSGPSVASHTWTCPNILIHSSMNLFRCIRAPLTIRPSQVQYPAPGHAAMSASDDEEVYETPIYLCQLPDGPARARLIRNGEWARGQRKVSQAEEKGRRSGLNIESNAELTDALAVRGQAAAFNLLELAKQATFLCQDPGQLHCRSLARPFSKMRKWKVSSRMKKRRMELLKDDDMEVLAGHKVKLEVEDPDDERQ
ncbi:hypothetical protein FOBRF1_006330 [Fusarium oxysporum]